MAEDGRPVVREPERRRDIGRRCNFRHPQELAPRMGPSFSASDSQR